MDEQTIRFNAIQMAHALSGPHPVSLMALLKEAEQIVAFIKEGKVPNASRD